VPTRKEISLRYLGEGCKNPRGPWITLDDKTFLQMQEELNQSAPPLTQSEELRTLAFMKNTVVFARGVQSCTLSYFGGIGDRQRAGEILFQLYNKGLIRLKHVQSLTYIHPERLDDSAVQPIAEKQRAS
jgi:hypothetical protein